MAANSAALDALGIAYFGASVDATDANEKFANEVNAKYPLLSDPTKQFANALGVVSPRGFANRWTYYVDKTGTVVAIDKKVNVNTHGKDIVNKVKELKLNSNS